MPGSTTSESVISYEIVMGRWWLVMRLFVLAQAEVHLAFTGVPLLHHSNDRKLLAIISRARSIIGYIMVCG